MKKENIMKCIKQFFKFGIVGCINTFSSWLFYYSLLFLKVNYLVATTIAYVLSSIIGFLLNKSWVFESKVYDYKTIVKYYIVYGSSYLTNMCAMYLWVDVLHLSTLIAPILTLLITVPYNYFFSRIWVFNEKENKYLKEPKKYHTFAICAYKESPYLEECIQSILNQTIKTNVILVSSTENKHITSLGEKYHIPVLYRHEKSDIEDDWNFGVNNSKTELVTIAHQDDVYDSYYAENILNNYTGKELMLFTENYFLKQGKKINDKNLVIKRILKIPLCIPGCSNIRFIRKLTLAFGNTINCPSVTYNKALIREPIFTSDLKFALDWDTFYKIYKRKGKVKYIPKKLISFRIHDASTTASWIHANTRQIEDTVMFQKFWPKPIVKIIMKFYVKCYEVYDKEDFHVKK